MSTTEARTDAKAGYCSSCRAGSHGLCASVRCTCTTGRHELRPRSLAPTGRSSAQLVANQLPRLPSGGHDEDGRSHDERFGEFVEARKPAVGIVWEDPPEPRAKAGMPLALKLADILAELQEHPSKWARIVVYVSGSGATTGARSLRKTLGGEWEFRGVSSKDEPGSRLYARYVGQTGKARRR